MLRMFAWMAREVVTRKLHISIGIDTLIRNYKKSTGKDIEHCSVKMKYRFITNNEILNISSVFIHKAPSKRCYPL